MRWVVIWAALLLACDADSSGALEPSADAHGCAELMALTPPPSQRVVEGQTVTFTVAVSGDCGPVTFSLVAAPGPTARIDPATGVFSWTPPFDVVAGCGGQEDYEIVVHAATDDLDRAELRVVITVLNDEDHDGIADADDGDSCR